MITSANPLHLHSEIFKMKDPTVADGRTENGGFESHCWNAHFLKSRFRTTLYAFRLRKG